MYDNESEIKTRGFRKRKIFYMVLSAVCFLAACKKQEEPAENVLTTQSEQLIQETQDRVGTESGSEAVSPDETRYFTAEKIQKDDAVYRRIYGKSYVKNDNIALEDLRYLRLLHYDFNHCLKEGELIVNKAIAQDVLEVFKALFEEGYEIETMRLVDDYWPEEENELTAPAGVIADAVSMSRNNTSGFNYRVVPEAKNLSRHALGYAVDINPLQNPYVVFDRNGEQILQAEGDSSYIDRENIRPHMISHDDRAYILFTEHGFEWGGDWSSSRDYQHFVKVPGK